MVASNGAGPPFAARPAGPTPVVEAVVRQHAEDLSSLWVVRRASVKGPSSLSRLARLDQRLAANLDGLVLAGPEGVEICQQAAPPSEAHGMFAGLTLAMRLEDAQRLDQLMSIAEALPETVTGLLAGFGWTSAASLRGVVRGLLVHSEPFRRFVAVGTCALHRVDPGAALRGLVNDPSPLVRARAVRAAGEFGRRDLLSACLERRDDDEVQFWAAWSAVLLGDRHAALDLLMTQGVRPGPYRDRAFALALQAMPAPAAHAALQRLAADKSRVRWVIQGGGIAGDPAYVPWFVRQMQDPRLARIAGEAFTFISGVNLGADALDRPAPEGFEAGPTDDPDDPRIESDPDDGLPWPDAQKIQAWWEVHGKRFQPGARYFMGEPVGRARCLDVLRQGSQRQRVLAAHYLCLLDPGTPLFNTSAPAWRQQRLLSAMS